MYGVSGLRCCFVVLWVLGDDGFAAAIHCLIHLIPTDSLLFQRAVQVLGIAQDVQMGREKLYGDHGSRPIHTIYILLMQKCLFPDQ